MVPAIRDIGKRISSMGRDLRPGQMVQATKATMWRAVKMERVASHGQTRALIPVILSRTISKVKVSK